MKNVFFVLLSLRGRARGGGVRFGGVRVLLLCRFDPLGVEGEQTISKFCFLVDPGDTLCAGRQATAGIAAAVVPAKPPTPNLLLQY